MSRLVLYVAMALFVLGQVAVNLYYWPRVQAVGEPPPIAKVGAPTATAVSQQTTLSRPVQLVIATLPPGNILHRGPAAVVTSSARGGLLAACGEVVLELNGIGVLRACDAPPYRTITSRQVGPDVTEFISMAQRAGLDTTAGVTSSLIAQMRESLGASPRPFELPPSMFLWAPETGREARLLVETGDQVNPGEPLAEYGETLLKVRAPNLDPFFFERELVFVPEGAEPGTSIAVRVSDGDVVVGDAGAAALLRLLPPAGVEQTGNQGQGSVEAKRRLTGLIRLAEPLSGTSVPTSALFLIEASGGPAVCTVATDTGDRQVVDVQIVETLANRALLSSGPEPGTAVLLGPNAGGRC